MIVSSGYNIGGPEVENALLSHPDVAEAAVIVLPIRTAGRSSRPSWCSRTAQTTAADEVIELQNFVKAMIAPYKYPRAIAFVSSLPRTATGKIQRYRLRAEAADAPAAPPAGRHRAATDEG